MSYKRIFDVVASSLLIVLLSIPLFILAVIVKVTSGSPILYWSSRVGKNNRRFQMPKFRSMRAGAPQLPTHLMTDPEAYLTPAGSFLRWTSLDELPQLFSILVGDLSFVGPRPALFNQDDLVALRTARGIHRLLPGVTGWAQVNGRDELSIPAKVQFDLEYLERQSLKFDLKILSMTVVKVLRCEGIDH